MSQIIVFDGLAVIAVPTERQAYAVMEAIGEAAPDAGVIVVVGDDWRFRDARSLPGAQEVVDRLRAIVASVEPLAVSGPRLISQAEVDDLYGGSVPPGRVLTGPATRPVNPLSNFGDDENDRMPWQQDEPGPPDHPDG